jgi:hypothetical protein
MMLICPKCKAASVGLTPPIDNDTSCNDPSGYKHPILDLDLKDAESLNEHMQGRFLRSRRM